MIDTLASTLVIPTVGIAIAGSFLLATRRRVIAIAALAGQYVFVAWMSLSFLPVSFGMVRLLTGLLTSGMLYQSTLVREQSATSGALLERLTGKAFRLIAYGIVLVAAYGVFSSRWFNIPGMEDLVLLSAIGLASSGLLQIGISRESLPIGMGLITLLCGFEMLYTFLEPSRAMIALQAAVHLALALVISYLDSLLPTSSVEGDKTR